MAGRVRNLPLLVEPADPAAEVFTVLATAPDFMRWEEVTGRSLNQLLTDERMSDRVSLAYFAAKRAGLETVAEHKTPRKWAEAEVAWVDVAEEEDDPPTRADR